MKPEEALIQLSEVLDKTVVKTFCINVKKYRIQCGLDQETLANLVGIPIQDIQAIEDGLSLPSYAISLVIALHLRCTIDDLLIP